MELLDPNHIPPHTASMRSKAESQKALMDILNAVQAVPDTAIYVGDSLMKSRHGTVRKRQWRSMSTPNMVPRNKRQLMSCCESSVIGLTKTTAAPRSVYTNKSKSSLHRARSLFSDLLTLFDFTSLSQRPKGRVM